MKKVKTKFVGKIASIENRHDLQLVTDSQDIEAIAEYFGKPDFFEDFGGCFVKVKDGEYSEVYCYEGTVPELRKSLYEIIW